MSTTEAATFNLRFACLEGDTQGIRRALEAGADPNKFTPGSHYTPLHIAAMKIQPEAVTILLSAGAHVDVRTGYQRTPLILASGEYRPNESKRARRAVALALIKAGADVDARDGRDETPFSRALFYGFRFIILDLLRAGAAVHTTDVERYLRDTSAWALVDAIKKAGGFDEYAARQLDVHVSILTKCFGDKLPLDVKKTIVDFRTLRGGY